MSKATQMHGGCSINAPNQEITQVFSKSQNVFVIGSTGYIGSKLVNHLSQPDCRVIGMAGSDPVHPLDLGAKNPLVDNPFREGDLVVFTAAISSPDQCANAQERCWRVNVEGTSKVIDAAISSGARVLFFSSDAVFPPDEGKAYDEESPRGPAFAYGQMKAEVERRFESSSLFKALRLSYVVSDHDRYISYLAHRAARGELAEVFHPFYRSVTTLSDVLASVSWLANRWGEYPCTYLHVCGSELVSRVRIADELGRIPGFAGVRYRVVDPPEGFFDHRSTITQTKSLYAVKHGIYDAYESFTEKFQREMKGTNK